jgi:hypothetical protein
MKLLPTIVLVLTGLLAGTACQPIPSKPENVSAEPGPLASTATHAAVDNLAAPQLEPGVRHLKEQLGLTEQQTTKLNEIFHDTNAQRAALRKQAQELQNKKLERINGILTAKQAKKYEQIRSEFPPPGIMKEQLSLTEQQATKLNEIFRDTNAQRAALRKQVQGLQKKKLERVNGVLTEKQAKKYEQIRSEPPPEIMESHPSLGAQPLQPTE